MSSTDETVTPEEVAQVVNDRLKSQGIDVDDTPQPETKVEALSTESSQDVNYTDVEKQALDQGWNPKGPKDAQTFLEHGDILKPVTSELSKVNKENKELRTTIDELKRIVATREERELNKELSQLQEQKNRAVSLGDVDAVQRIDEEIDQRRMPEAPTEVEDNPNTINPAALEFVERHRQWTKASDEESLRMQRDAQFYDNYFAEQDKLEPEAHLRKIEDKLKELYPHRFEEQSVPPVQRVESDTQSHTAMRSNKRYTFDNLSEHQKSCYKLFVRRGVMSGDEYIKSLVDAGDLK